MLLPTWLPVKLRFFLLLPRSLRKSPLRGDSMARWLFEALEGMDAGGSEPEQHRDARAGGRPARPLRDDHRFLRLRPPGADRRPADRARLAAPPRARVHVRARIARPVQARQQRQPRLRGANDLVLPRRLPARQHRGLPEVGAERRPRRPEALLPRLRARGRAAGEHATTWTAACSTTSRSAGRSTRSRPGAPTSRSSGGCCTSSPIPGERFLAVGGKPPPPKPAPTTLKAILARRQRHPATRADPRRPAQRPGAQRQGGPDQGRDRDELLRRRGLRRRRRRRHGRHSGGRPEREARRMDGLDQQAHRRRGRARVRHVPAPEDQRHRRPLCKHGLQRLRLPRRLEPRPARAKRPAPLGERARALHQGPGAHGAAGAVPPSLRPGLPGAASALRHVGAALVVPRPGGREGGHSSARGSRPRQADPVRRRRDAPADDGRRRLRRDADRATRDSASPTTE